MPSYDLNYKEIMEYFTLVQYENFLGGLVNANLNELRIKYNQNPQSYLTYANLCNGINDEKLLFNCDNAPYLNKCIISDTHFIHPYEFLIGEFDLREYNKWDENRDEELDENEESGEKYVWEGNLLTHSSYKKKYLKYKTKYLILKKLMKK